MVLLRVVQVEPLMIIGNLDHVEKSLKVGIAIHRIEEVIERSILELRKSEEPSHEKANVVVARLLGRESTVLRSNLELARLSNLGIPLIKRLDPDNGGHLHRFSNWPSSSNMLLQTCNLLYQLSVLIHQINTI